MVGIQKIFCDLDGTLIDVSERNYRVYAEVTAEFGGSPLNKADYWELKRKRTKWPELLHISGLPADIEIEYLTKFVEKIESPEYLKLDTLMVGAVEAVKKMAAQCQVYLVSLRRNYHNLTVQLDSLGLERYFAKVLSGHSETDGYDKKIELIGGELNDSRGAIIGDTEADVVTGKQLGMVTIALTSGVRDGQFLRSLEPDYLLPGIREVPKVLSEYQE